MDVFVSRWIYILLTVAMSLLAEARAGAQSSCLAQVTAQNTSNCSSKRSPLTDSMRAVCEEARQALMCDQLYKAAKPEDRARFFSCDDPKDLCEQVEGAGSTRIYGCAEGLGGVAYEFGVSVLKIPSDVWHLYANLKSLPRALRDCPKTLEQKKFYLGDLKPAEMTDATLDRLSCVEMETFARQKVDVIMERIESRRQNQMAETGRDDLQTRYEDLSAAEKHAVDFDFKTSGPLNRARCYRPEEAARAACYEIGNLAVKTADVYMAGKGALKLLRTIVPAEAEGLVAQTGRYQTKKMDWMKRGEAKDWLLPVRHLTAKELSARRLHFKDGLIYDSRGRKVTATEALYVMDANGSFYATTDGTLKHSSLTAGGRAASAGTITIQDGRLQMISRDSGHYMPSEDHLEQAVTELRMHDVDMSHVNVTDYTRSSNPPVLKPGEVPGVYKPNPETIGVDAP